MNSESLNLLSQKVDGVLTTVRNLRQEAANLKQALAQANSELQDKAMLLETANASLVDCKAALDARANQAAAQDESLVQKQAEIDNLNAKINSMTDTVESFNGQLMEKNGIIDALNGQISEKNGTIDALNGQIAEKNGIIDALNGQIAEKDSALQELNTKNASESESLQAQVESLRAELAGKDSAIERLNAELNDKTACIEKMGETIQAQGEEITEAQEKFKQLMDTIEKELGTEFPVCKNFEPPAAVSAAATAAAPAPAEQAAPAEQSAPAEQPAAAPVEEAPAAEPVKEPTVEPVDDEPVLDFNQISEDEDLPIEVHGANEKDNDLFSASNGGSQTNFFG